MDVVHNDKIVGFNNFYFQKQGETFIVKNEVYFSISVLGVEVFKVKSNTEEEYRRKYNKWLLAQYASYLNGE